MKNLQSVLVISLSIIIAAWLHSNISKSPNSVHRLKKIVHQQEVTLKFPKNSTIEIYDNYVLIINPDDADINSNEAGLYLPKEMIKLIVFE